MANRSEIIKKTPSVPFRTEDALVLGETPQRKTALSFPENLDEWFHYTGGTLVLQFSGPGQNGIDDLSGRTMQFFRQNDGFRNFPHGFPQVHALPLKQLKGLRFRQPT